MDGQTSMDRPDPPVEVSPNITTTAPIIPTDHPPDTSSVDHTHPNPASVPPSPSSRPLDPIIPTDHPPDMLTTQVLPNTDAIPDVHVPLHHPPDFNDNHCAGSSCYLG